jgi:phytoene dehydrogenase-like protein
MTQRLDAVVVGAGLAGLVAARQLTNAGLAIRVFEASDGPGGRMRTDEVDGFRLDRGFHTVCPSYPALDRELDVPALRLRPFTRGIGVLAKGESHRLAPDASALGALRSGLLSLRDVAALARLAALDALGPAGRLKHRSDRTTFDELRAAGFGESAIDRVFRPFLSGIYGEDTLNTSGRFFHLVWRSLLRGGAAVPAEGIQAIPNQLAARLPADSITYGAKVTSVHPGVVKVGGHGEVRAPAVIVATDASTAARLLPGLTRPIWYGLTTFFHATVELPAPEPLLLVDAEQPTVIRHTVVLSAAAPEYAPAGCHLVATTVLGAEGASADKPGAELERRVRTRLAALHQTSTAHWDLVGSYSIAHALPAMIAPHPLRRRVRLDRGLYVCGDHRDTSSIQGALVSGRRAALAALADLSMPARTTSPARVH